MRTLLFAVAFANAVFAVAGSVGGAVAQTYPTKPITVVVPFAAGGPTDVLARILGERMRVALGQSVVIENVTGAAGSIGVGRVVRAAADGYTIGIGNLSTHVVNGAIYPLPYDLQKDLEPVALVSTNPLLVVTSNALPARNLRELIAWLKQNEGKVTVGTAGVGSASHFSGVFFQKLTGTQLQFVPYRGTGPALQDLMGGQISLMVDQASNSMAHERAGKLRAYAVTADKRLAAMPDIPSVDEAGLAGFYVSLWCGLWAPKGTPKEIVAKLNAAVVSALADATLHQRFADLGLETPPREQQSPEALAAYQKAEIAKWWPIIKAANIKIE